MAYVALSRDLRHEIDSKIRSMMRTELDAIKPAEGAITELYVAAAPEAKRREIASKTPEGLKEYMHLFTRQNRLVYHCWEVDIVIMDGTGDDAKPISSGRHNVGEVPAFMTLQPSGQTVHQYPRPQYKFDRDTLLAVADNRAGVEAGLAHYDARTECIIRWNTVARQISTFLDSCKSLNEALKLLPDIERYVPPYYLERVGEKRGTSSAKKTDEEARKAEVLAALKAVDIDTVRTSEVLARMASGGSNA